MYPLAIVHRAWKHVREQIRVMVYLSSHAKDIRCHTISIGHFAFAMSSPPMELAFVDLTCTVHVAK